ncbi:putative mRNA stability protein [Seiridium cardinale]
MNPLQKNKIDIKLTSHAPPQSLSPDEQRLFRLYGKLPSKSDHFAKHLKDRKYFDSGDYAMSKAGKGDSVDTGSVGSQHPVPENIPHLSSPNGANSNSGLPMPHHSSIGGGQAASPIKESSFLNRESSADDAEEKTAAGEPAVQEEKGIPIRR